MRYVIISLLAYTLSSPVFAQVGALPVPPECASSANLTMDKHEYNEKIPAYSKVDIYCTKKGALKKVASGVTWCNSDYERSKVEKNTALIAVAPASKAKKAMACKTEEHLKFVPAGTKP